MEDDPHLAKRASARIATSPFQREEIKLPLRCRSMRGGGPCASERPSAGVM